MKAVRRVNLNFLNYLSTLWLYLKKYILIFSAGPKIKYFILTSLELYLLHQDSLIHLTILQLIDLETKLSSSLEIFYSLNLENIIIIDYFNIYLMKIYP